MLTIENIRPPKKELPIRKIHTIHLLPNRVWANIPDNNKSGVSVVAFRREYDAVFFASMLEEHKRRTGDWPPLSIEGVSMPVTRDQNLYELFVSTWSDKELDHFCASVYMNLLCINSMDQTGDTITLTGECFDFDPGTDFYRDMLEENYIRI